MVHPISEAVVDVRAALKAVADANPSFMATGDKATALLEIGRAEAQLRELKLRVLADAGDVAETTASRDAAEWLAHHGRERLDETRADLRLATALDRRYAVLARALREGEANPAQARVVAQALDGLPDDVGVEVLSAAEAHLVVACADFGPRALARIGRRILEVVAPDVADEAEARRLAELEKAAHRKTRLTLRRLGDGTTASPPGCPTSPPPGWPPTSTRSPTPARPLTTLPTPPWPGSTLSRGLPTPAGSGRGSASSWSASTPTGCRCTAATPPPWW
jgi:hypothetical protein